MNTLNYFLTKYNLPEKGTPIEIPNVGRIDVIRWIRELNFTKGAEIGVDYAEFSKQICENNDQLKLYGIDPYLKYDEYREYESQEQMDKIYAHALMVMENSISKDCYQLIRKKSEDAVKDFEDESLDFVYIDGNHEGKYPLQDIELWTPKVKKGGIVAGHDYVRIRALRFTIKDALEKYTVENKINPWFVLGSYAMNPREIRDNTRSWMFVRQ